MKKILSILLALVMIFSSISTGVLAANKTVGATGNLMAGYTYRDWSVTNRAIINAPTESFSGDMSNAFSVTKLMWRSAYTKLDLEAGETYKLKFYYKEENPSKVYLTDNGNRGVLMAPTGAMTFGDEIFLTNNDYSNNLLNDLNYNIPSDKEGWNIVTAVISPSVTGEHTFCFTGAGPDVNDLSLIHFSDFSLVKQGEDPNVLANTKASDWFSGWNGNTGESVSGAIAVKTAWRSGYTKVTLKPNTEYDFNFNASTVKISDVRVYPASEITSNTQLTCPAGGGNLPGGTTNLAAGAFSSTAPTQDFSKATADVVNAYYTVSESFTTTNETEYYIVLDCTQFLDNGSVNIYCTFVHLKDLSLVAKGDGADEEPNQDPNVLNDEVMKSLTWKALWGTVTNNPKGTDLDKSESFSGNSYAMTFVRNARYRDNYTVVTLKPNTTYNFSFRYKSVTDEFISGLGFVDTSKVDFSTIKGDRVKNHLTDASTEILGAAEASIGREVGGPWNLGTTTFKTGSATEYVMFFAVEEVVADQGFTTMTLSDFSLIAEEGQPEQPGEENALVNSKATDWFSSWNSNSGTTTPEGYFKVLSAWRSAYTKVTLKPNTKYNFEFSHGEVRVTDIRVFAASEITDPATQLVSASGGGVAPGGTTNLATNAVVTTCPATPAAGEFYTSSESFTTTNETEYYIFLDCGAFSTTSILLKDLKLVLSTEDDNPVGSGTLVEQLINVENWNSTWRLQGANINITKSTDSFEGGEAVSVDKSNYRSTFVKLNLAANTKYKLTFNYKGKSAVSNLHLIALNDIDSAKFAAKPDQLFNALKTDVGTVFTQNYSALNYDGNTWNKVSASFKTNNNTEYYLVFENNTAGSGFVASDFAVEIDTTPDEDDEEDLPDPDNLLADTKPSDWTSSWGYRKGVAAGNAISLGVAWRSGYTKVTLKPNVSYQFKFNFENVKVTDIRVYAASEITDLDTQMLSEEGGGAAKGGINNLAPDAITTTCITPVAGETYTASEIFTTSSATEYYIIFDAADFVVSSILLKKISLKEYFDPATDVFGTIRNTNGGTVKNKGETPYEKGKETTVTATPLEGNTFVGWFDADGTKVSSDEAYTFTVKGEFDLTAKFSGSNMPYIDWMAENGIDGTFETGTMPGWYAYDPSTGVIATFASFNPKDFASHSGKKALVISARYQTSNFEFKNLTKNSDYYLSFYIYCPDLMPYDGTAEVGKQGFRLNQLSLNVGGDTIWSKSNHFSDGNNGWHRVEFFFNTGNATSATLSIFYAGDSFAVEKSIHLDDLMFVQYVADGLDNGDFEAGKDGWMGKYTVADESGNKVASIANGEKLYQSVAVDAHSLYTVSFKAKGALKAAATQINKYSTKPSDLVSSVTNVTTSGEWNEYTLDVYTGMNSAINLVFEALADGAMVDDIKVVKAEDSTGAILEKIDFETDRFAIKNSTTNKDVYEVYEGTEFAHSGNKSLHFKYGAADSETEYVFNESYLGFQISNKRVYKLSFYYKTTKGNMLKISPDFLGTQAGKISVTQTAAGDGWYLVEFFASSSSAIYFDPIIANIVGKTKADFYVDDITYTIMSATVLDSEPTGLYAEPPVALLYNEGFENAITAKNWGKLTSAMKVIKGDTQFGEKFLRVNGKNFYVLRVSVEAGAQYYLTASVRGTSTGGYLGLSTTADGKGLFAGVTGKIESFIKPTSKKWQRSGFKFSAPMSGTIYLVIAQESGTMDIDNVLIYKEQYALEEIPNGHDIIKPYDYKATSGKNYIVNGGYNADGSVAEDGSPSTGDTFPAVTIVLITLAAAVTMLLTGRKNKKEAE